MVTKYSDDDLREIIENEGLGYAVQYYLGSNNIENPDTADLWQAAYEALNKLTLHLELEE